MQNPIIMLRDEIGDIPNVINVWIKNLKNWGNEQYEYYEQLYEQYKWPIIIFYDINFREILIIYIINIIEKLLNVN